MLDQLHTLATRLRWLQPVAVIVGLAALGTAGYVIVAATQYTDTLLIPAILAFCWSLVLISMLNLFAGEPPRVYPDAGFLKRSAARIHRGMKSLLALAFVVLTATLAWLSFKLFTTGIG